RPASPGTRRPRRRPRSRRTPSCPWLRRWAGARYAGVVSLVAPLGGLDVFEFERFLVQHGSLLGELPRRDVREALVVAEGLAVFSLGLGPEVPAARLGAVQRVDAHQLAELEEVGHSPGLLQLLVELGGLAGDLDALVELVLE